MNSVMLWKTYSRIGGWDSVELDSQEVIENRIGSRDFYTHIELRPRSGESICLDKTIIQLTQMLFVGLVRNKYSPGWVNLHFYFDIRGFFFLPRTELFYKRCTQPLWEQTFYAVRQEAKEIRTLPGCRV